METLENSRHRLSEQETAQILKTISGNTMIAKEGYFNFVLGKPHQAQAELDFYPDYLNGKHRIVIREASFCEGDKDYKEGINLLANAVRTLKDAGIRADISTDDFSDGEELVGDIWSAVNPKKQPTESEIGDGSIAA